MIRVVAILGGLILAAAAASAGAWPVGERQWYAQVGLAWLESDRLATPGGTEVPIPDFERQEVSLYAEYGLDPHWTVILRAPLVIESSIEAFGSAHGPGDLALGLQRQLLPGGSTRLALRATLQAPTGDEELGQGLLPTGSGVWEGELVLSLGRSFAAGRGWTFVEGGHQVRGGGFVDGFVYRSQLGLHVGPRVWLAWNVAGVEPYSRRAAGAVRP